MAVCSVDPVATRLRRPPRDTASGNSAIVCSGIDLLRVPVSARQTCKAVSVMARTRRPSADHAERVTAVDSWPMPKCRHRFVLDAARRDRSQSDDVTNYNRINIISISQSLSKSEVTGIAIGRGALRARSPRSLNGHTKLCKNALECFILPPKNEKCSCERAKLHPQTLFVVRKRPFSAYHDPTPQVSHIK